MKSVLTVRCPITVHFYDVDPMNVVWHGNYLKFFEVARYALLEHLRYNYQQMKESGYVWPIVDFQIKYIRPVVLHQKIIVEAQLLEYENRLKIEYRICDEQSNELLTKANSIQVAVNEKSFTMEFESPQVLIERIKEVMQ
jgi:acyl-CoA thioester hydrolase